MHVLGRTRLTGNAVSRREDKHVQRTLTSSHIFVFSFLLCSIIIVRVRLSFHPLRPFSSLLASYSAMVLFHRTVMRFHFKPGSTRENYLFPNFAYRPPTPEHNSVTADSNSSNPSNPHPKSQLHPQALAASIPITLCKDLEIPLPHLSLITSPPNPS